MVASLGLLLEQGEIKKHPAIAGVFCRISSYSRVLSNSCFANGHKPG